MSLLFAGANGPNRLSWSIGAMGMLADRVNVVADRVKAAVTVTKAIGIGASEAACSSIDRPSSERARCVNAEDPAVPACPCAARRIRLIHFPADHAFGARQDSPDQEADETSSPIHETIGLEVPAWSEQLPAIVATISRSRGIL
jgi:hypothetical protein